IFNETLLTVAVVVRDEGKANLLSGENIFLNLTFAQHMFGRTGDINIIAVSNKGDVEAGVGLTDSAVSEIESVLGIGEGSSIEVDTVKKDDLEFAQSASEQIAEIFSIMGTFSIIAGVILVINIFVMLAEERKPEMGVSRALGMKRRHLVQTYLFEGSAYALIASFLGTFAGLGIAYLMVLAFGHMFGQAAGIEIPFHFEFISLVLGFCIGVTITFLTVILASWVVSRLNIVRAIRTVPEPSLNRSSRKFVSGAILLVALGILFLLGGISSLSGALFMTGPCMFLLGGAMLLSAYLRPRIPYTVASIAIIFWILAPIEWMEGLQSGLEMFILSGIFLVLSAVLLLMANSDSLISVLIRAIARREKTLPVARVALSYPMKKKFRTGMTLAMFALIIFTVTVIAMIASFQTNSIESAYLEQAGGYDILGVSNTITPIMNISERISSIPSLSGEFVEISSFTYSVVDVYHKERGENSSITVGIYGADSSFFENNDFTFRSMMEGYGSPDEIWEAVRTDSSLVVVDGSAVENMHYETAMMGSLKAKIGDQIVVHTLQGPSAKT
ncbi:MAG: ABC transporter permease, partial [Thermoplasmata archaeon]